MLPRAQAVVEDRVRTNKAMGLANLPSSKWDVNQGLPLVCAISAANVNDSQAFQPLLRGIFAVRPRRGPCRRRPAKLHGDKAYHSHDQHRWLRERGIGVRIARPSIESSQ